jgi:hypothetical protein
VTGKSYFSTTRDIKPALQESMKHWDTIQQQTKVIGFEEHMNPADNASILEQLTAAISAQNEKKPSNPTTFVATRFSVKSVGMNWKRMEPRRFILALK